MGIEKVIKIRKEWKHCRSVCLPHSGVYKSKKQDVEFIYSVYSLLKQVPMNQSKSAVIIVDVVVIVVVVYSRVLEGEKRI